MKVENAVSGVNMANDIQEELDDLSNTMFGDGLKSCSTSPLEGGLLSEDPDSCGICMSTLLVPRVLSCLHVFCEQCLDNKLIGGAGDAAKLDSVITCLTCKQETKVGAKKITSLPLDIITTNVMDVSNLTNLTCTCCTTKEIAVSRCCTCHNLLCSNCNSAHQYMRCFENHKVIMLDELKVSGKKIPIHKILMCDIHATEPLTIYCSTCQQLVCAECSKLDHRTPVHHCDTVTDAETRVKAELESLLGEGKAKVDVLMQANTDFDASLGELANQRSTARDLINESYQSYKAVLERCRDESLTELNELYHDRELKLMDMSHRVGKDVNLVEDACKFAQRLLENGNIMEIMYLKKFVSTQLLNLINNTPKPEKSFSIEFESDFEKFEQTIKAVFGRFTTESDPKGGSPLSIMPAPLSINGGNLSLTNGCTSSLNNSSPISLPTSMQSSFDGDLQSNLPGFALSQGVLSPDSPVGTASANAIAGFTSIAEYNLQQLASLAEKVDLGDSVMSIAHGGPANPSSAPSPTPSFTLADLLTGDPNTVNTAYHNLQALAKLGLNSTDVSNGTIVLGRGNSPGLDHTSTLTLSNPILNGFASMSASTSPILSTPEDILPESLHVGPNNSSNQSGNNASVARANKVSPMQIRCKFGQLGPSKGQFNSPHGFCLGTEEDIIVADTNNHRIQVFEKTGNYKFQFGIPGKDEGQLWYPRKVAVMRLNGKYVVCDRGNERSRMQIFTKNGHFIKKIAIRYIDIVAGLAVTTHGEIVAVDSVSPTVFVISENGELLRWFDCSDFMREPSDIAIHGKEYYVCDFKGHNVVVFSEQGEFLRRIGCENITNFPNGIDISDAGDILIGDSHGNRFHVAVFARDGSLVTEFECPYVKVSRCCGLKITSEGYVVTLAKNNHHVLVLNTLYIL